MSLFSLVNTKTDGSLPMDIQECMKAYRKGFTYVYGMEDEINADTIYFVEEAQKRGIFVPQDMIVLDHLQYIDQWFGFCEEYFHQ